VVTIASWEIATNDCPYMSISLSIYCAGCRHECPGCQNPALQDFNNGVPMEAADVVSLVTNRISLIESVVFLGGDWIYYPTELRDVSTQLKQLYNDLILILYTGELLVNIPDDILEHLDIVVDGPYKESEHTNYAIPVTSNQHVYINPYHYVFYEVDPSTLPINKEE